MNATLWKALFALLPATMLFTGSLVFLVKVKRTYSLLQLLGTSCLLLMIVAHVCEGLHLVPWMGWGLEHSAGHYLDLGSAVLAFTLFPLGYLLHAFAK